MGPLSGMLECPVNEIKMPDGYQVNVQEGNWVQSITQTACFIIFWKKQPVQAYLLESRINFCTCVMMRLEQTS